MPQSTTETTTSRLALMMGNARLKTLASACVWVLGCGGVGSNAIVALARGGVGHLCILDRDVVEASNINRQAVAFHSTLGRKKTEVMKEIVHDINPSCTVDTLSDFLAKDTIAEQLSCFPTPDYVIDAIDTIAQKLRIAAWCQEEGFPLISSMGGANKLHPEMFEITTIEKTKSCPISRVMRKECRKRGIKKLEVLYSREVPMPIGDVEDKLRTSTTTSMPSDTRACLDVDESLENTSRKSKAQTLGTMSFIPPIMGYMLAGHVICKLADMENPYARYQS